MRCNELSDKLATYDKLKATSNGIGIAGMTVTEIIENLPMVSDDIAAIIDALVDAYGEGVIFPTMLKRFSYKMSSGDVTKELS